MRGEHRRVPGLAGTAALALAALLLSGCSSIADDLAEQYRDGDGKGYITQSGVITEFAPAERGAPVEFSGPLDIGGTASSDDYRGRVLVVNFWWSTCPPCRVEAPHLESVYQEFREQGVAFLGVNVREEAATSVTFAEEFGVHYPSILDAQGAAVQLAFAGSGLPPNSIPTTLVLDAEGRVAARILGMIDSPSVLRTLVKDTLAETAPTGAGAGAATEGAQTS